jgi:co-chaperonin GroES (HSP10)
MTKPAFSPTKVMNLRPLKDTVLVTDMQFKERKLNSGIVLLNDNGTTAGIRPRWGRIYAIGPDQKDYSVGQWICVAHGRWTRGIDIEGEDGVTFALRRVDPKDILLVSDTRPDDSTMSDAIQAQDKNRFA